MADSFYTAWAEVVPDFSGFGKEVDKGFKKSMGPAGQVAGDDAGKGVRSGVLGTIGKLAAPLAAAFAAIGIGGIIRDSITQANDLEQTSAAIATVFGDAASPIQKFAKDAGAAFGISQQQALEASQMYGTYGKAAGLAGSDLSSFATDLTGLGADLAAFYGGDVQTALDAISAGLRGESEPLRQFGVLLDDATLKSRAMAMGIFDGTGSLTQQQRVLAAQAEILAQTTDAQGQAAAEAGSFDGQLKRLTAGWESLVTTMGQLFLPIATTIVTFLASSLVPGLQNAMGWLTGGGLGGAFASVVGFIQPVIDILASAFVPVFQELAPIIGSVIPQLISLWTNLSPLGIIIGALAGALPSLSGAFAQIASVIAGVLGTALKVIVPILNHVAAVVTSVLKSALAAVIPVILQLVPVIAQLATSVGLILGKVLQALAPIIHMIIGVFAQIVPVIMPVITAILGLIGPLLQLIDPLLRLIGEILPPIIDLFMGILGPVLELASTIIGALMPVISGLIEILAGLIEFVVGVFTGDWDKAWKGLQRVFQGFVDAIGGLIDGGLKILFEGIPKFIGDIFKNVGTWLVDAGKALIQGFIDGILGTINLIGDAIGGVMDFIGGFFPNSPAKRGPFSGSGWTGLKQSGSAIYDQFMDGFGGDDPTFPPFDGPTGPIIRRPPSLNDGGFGAARDGASVVQNITMQQTDPRIQARQLGRETERVFASS